MDHKAVFGGRKPSETGAEAEGLAVFGRITGFGCAFQWSRGSRAYTLGFSPDRLLAFQAIGMLATSATRMALRVGSRISEAVPGLDEDVALVSGGAPERHVTALPRIS